MQIFILGKTATNSSELFSSFQIPTPLAIHHLAPTVPVKFFSYLAYTGSTCSLESNTESG